MDLLHKETVLWTVRRYDHEVRCQVLVRRGAVQARILWDQIELYSVTFTEPEPLLSWARDKRGDFEARGWKSTGREKREEVPVSR